MSQAMWHWAVGPPGSRLPLVAPQVRYRYNRLPPIAEELGGFREPWTRVAWAEGSLGDGVALWCLDGWPTTIHGQKFESKVFEIHN